MAHFDATDDDWPTSAFDEPTVVLDKSGMRVPAYALEGLAADMPVFERDDPAMDRLLAQLVSLRRSIKSRNVSLTKALADPAKRKKFAEYGTRKTFDLAQPRPVSGMGAWWNPLDLATAAYDAATDLMIGQSVGTQAASRNTAEHLQEMVKERVETGQVAGERARQLTALAAENVKAISEPAKVFVATTAKEVGKNISKATGSVMKILKYGVPIVGGLWVLTLVMGRP